MVSKDKKGNAKAVGGGISPPGGATSSRFADERDVGTALRAAYQQAVEEKIPSEMLDLLGKLS